MLSFSRAYQNLPLPEHPRSWAEIDLCALRQNYRALRGVLQAGCAPVAVVKADAYGHGAATCASALLREGCRRFAVSCIEEGISLRKALGQNARILILGYTDPALAPTLAAFDLAQALCSPTHAAALCRAAGATGVCVRVHYALDTGMNRLGFPAQTETEIAQTAKEILQFSQNKRLISEGLFTHFACADKPENTQNDLQAERFACVRARLLHAGLRLFCHTCNSAGALTRPNDHWNGARFGIALWGVSPIPHFDLSLQPVMRLCTRVVHLHRVKPGERIGYGGAFCAARESLIATLPIGYADGWLRACEGTTVTLQTAGGAHRVPLVGRVCMDQCMADVTDTGACVGDHVILFGEVPSRLSELANRAGTIPYELLCLISSRVPRVYIENE